MYTRLIVSVLLLATHAVAEPQEKALALRWNAPETCENEAAILQKVEQQLGRPLNPSTTSLECRASVSSTKDGRFRVDLETTIRGEVRRRVLEGTSCAALANAVALVLAFLIDPDAVAAHSAAAGEKLQPSQLAAPPAEPAAPPELPASIESTPPAAAQRVDPTPPARAKQPLDGPRSIATEPRWFARALIGVDSGTLPAATIVWNVAVGRTIGPISAEISGSRFFPRSRLQGDAPVTRGGRFDLWALGASIGYRVALPKVELVPTVGVESGTVYGSGFGVAQPRQGKGLWLAATTFLQARYRPLSWLGAHAQVGAALPFARPSYVLDNVGGVYRSDIIAFRALSGLEAYF